MKALSGHSYFLMVKDVKDSVSETFEIAIAVGVAFKNFENMSLTGFSM